MSTSKEYKEGASKSNDDVCEVNDKLQKLSTADVPICANCGKEGEEVNNICNKCKVTTYCNAVCKKVHKKKHKKDCEEHVRLATEKHNEELRIAAELHDEKLFKQPPSKEDCPICFLRLPTLQSGSKYKSCCGKVICSGCIHAPVYDNQGNIVTEKKCAFCRTPWPSEKESIKRMKKRAEADDPIAIYNIGCDCRDGTDDYPQDYTKALELFHRAGDLGYSMAYGSIGWAYDHGEGVDQDKQKANQYYALAATEGDVNARHNLGLDEENEGNMDRAIKHYMISLRDGDADSLTAIQRLYTNGHATKDDYTKALRSYQSYLGEIKSKHRDEAAAADDNYRYY